MKATDKDKAIYTTPKGAWEGSIIFMIPSFMTCTPAA